MDADPWKRLQVSSTPHGRGVFTRAAIARGETVLYFIGPHLTRAALPADLTPATDYYLQIADDRFLGPSGQVDDYVNHSCAPNSGILMQGDNVALVALEPIPAGGEIHFDYSTTMHRALVYLSCACGATNCRGTIRDFVALPRPVQRRYLRLGIVPPFIRAHLASRVA